jgi:hypothetical protein
MLHVAGADGSAHAFTLRMTFLHASETRRREPLKDMRLSGDAAAEVPGLCGCLIRWALTPNPHMRNAALE